MDPPQPGEDEADGLQVVGGMVARLGLNINESNGRELIERLGLGEGTRIVDLQDDLPPGIDEPSLPALPGFAGAGPGSGGGLRRGGAAEEGRGGGGGVLLPPSFADSEAAQAVGGVATSGTGPGIDGTQAIGVRAGSGVGAAEVEGEAPPGYFGGTISPSHGLGPPAYS
jgi:hypothetical protein